MDIALVIQYLKENYRDITIKETANHSGYSESHFCRAFKKETGISPQDYLVGIKIENSVERLVAEDQRVLKSQLKTGYLSEGSFTNRIKKAMTLSPKQLSQQKGFLFEEYKLHELDDLMTDDEQENDIYVRLKCKTEFKGIVFIGLFRKPIPNQAPVIGKIVTNLDKNNIAAFNNVPEGKFYCLACVIHRTINPLKLFVHKDNLRGRVQETLIIPGKYHVELELRPPEAADPPITLNLPLMFINSMKEKKDEYRADQDKI